MSFRPFLALTLLLAGCVSATGGAPVSIAAPHTAFSNYVGYIEGRIGGRGAYWFLVDTGASRSALDRSLAADLGLQVGSGGTVQGSGGTVETLSARLPELELGGLSLRGLVPTVYDLSATPAPPGRRFAGILGYDVLKDWAVLFDRAGSRVAFARRAEAFGPLAGAVVIPFVLDNDIPRVRAEINDEPVELRLDTGAAIGPGQNTFINITQSFYERLGRLEPALTPYAYFTANGAGGQIRIPVVRARSFRLGGFAVAEPHLIVQQPVGYFASPDAVGFLGSYALQGRSRFIVDYPRRRLILFP